jgi:hypothetical protein
MPMLILFKAAALLVFILSDPPISCLPLFSSLVVQKLRFDSTFVRGLSLGILFSMILVSHSLDQTAHGALQIFDMRLASLIMSRFVLETPFCNSVFYSKTHLCANFGYIIMNYAMDVVIPLVFGLKVKISQT